MGAAGHRLQDAAARLGVSRRTLGRILQADEATERAWALGRSELHEKIISTLISKALGGDTIACLFLLKAGFAYREGEPPEPEQRAALVQINLPGALQPEQYARMIEVKPRGIEAEAERDADG